MIFSADKMSELNYLGPFRLLIDFPDLYNFFGYNGK